MNTESQIGQVSSKMQMKSQRADGEGLEIQMPSNEPPQNYRKSTKLLLTSEVRYSTRSAVTQIEIPVCNSSFSLPHKHSYQSLEQQSTAIIGQTELKINSVQGISQSPLL